MAKQFYAGQVGTGAKAPSKKKAKPSSKQRQAGPVLPPQYEGPQRSVPGYRVPVKGLVNTPSNRAAGKPDWLDQAMKVAKGLIAPLDTYSTDVADHVNAFMAKGAATPKPGGQRLGDTRVKASEVYANLVRAHGGDELAAIDKLTSYMARHPDRLINDLSRGYGVTSPG